LGEAGGFDRSAKFGGSEPAPFNFCSIVGFRTGGFDEFGLGAETDAASRNSKRSNAAIEQEVIAKARRAKILHVFRRGRGLVEINFWREIAHSGSGQEQR
jgi:hypothetical protein